MLHINACQNVDNQDVNATVSQKQWIPVGEEHRNMLTTRSIGACLATEACINHLAMILHVWASQNQKVRAVKLGYVKQWQCTVYTQCALFYCVHVP